MKVIPFVAESAADAVAQIREKLGPTAVVLNVRQIPPSGISKLWNKGRIEVLAYLPEEDQPVTSASELSPPAPPPPSMPAIPAHKSVSPAPIEPPKPVSTLNVLDDSPAVPQSIPQSPPPLFQRDYGRWEAGVVLENAGIMPRFAQKIVNQLRLAHGDAPPLNLKDEMKLVQTWLRQTWTARMESVAMSNSPVHILVGPPGSGKTTCLCKWIANAVMLQGQTARILRLDAHAANTAEILNVYSDIFQVPISRSLEETMINEDLVLVDVPGVNYLDADTLNQFCKFITSIPGAQIHLVLNAAYEMPVLMAQLRAFSVLPLSDLIFTHLDEDYRWAKLWNFVLGTNYTFRFLSAGQNIPGQFFIATPEHLLSGISC